MNPAVIIFLYLQLKDVCNFFLEKIEPYIEKKNLFGLSQLSRISNLEKYDKYNPFQNEAPNSSRDPISKKLSDQEKKDKIKKSPDPKVNPLKLVQSMHIIDKVKTLRQNSSRINPSNFQNYIKNVILIHKIILIDSIN